MTSNIKVLGSCKREIELNVDASEVKEEFNKILAQYSSRVKIPGFRPGKAPKDIIKQRFYPEIKESLISSLVPKVLSSELKALNLKPIGAPVVEDLHFEEEQPLHFKAQFEILPDFKLPEYNKIKVKKRNASVTDQEVNQSLEELRSKAAEYIPVEGRGVRDDDLVIVEIKGRDLKTKKMLPAEKGSILIGRPDNEEVLNKNLIGMNPGEEKEFIIDYDINYKNKRLAGKKIEYHLRVNSIKGKNLPELDDEFAKDLGEFKDLNDLKEKIKKELMSSKEKAVEKEVVDEIIKRISEKVETELPEALVEQEQMAILEHTLSLASRREYKHEDIEKLKAGLRSKAEENIKSHLILAKIAEQEELHVSEEEIHEEAKAIAKMNNIPLSIVVESINKEGKRETLKKSLQLKKAVDFLIKNAIINKSDPL